MSHRGLWIYILFIVLAPLLAESPLRCHSNFSFEEKPVGPECFIPLVSSKSLYEPVIFKGNACQEKQQTYDPINLKTGFIGYKVESKPILMKAPYVFYKHLGKIHLQNMNRPLYDLVEVEWSDGSTESSSGILVVEKTDQWLRLVQILDQGDRCFGSVHDAELKNGDLTYKKRITAQGLGDLLDQKEKTEDASPFFEDCAVCCIGDVTFKNGQIEGIQFTLTLQDVENKLKQEKANSPQACFDLVLKETLASGKTSLTLGDLKSFGQKVKEQCLAGKDLSQS